MEKAAFRVEAAARKIKRARSEAGSSTVNITNNFYNNGSASAYNGPVTSAHTQDARLAAVPQGKRPCR